MIVGCRLSLRRVDIRRDHSMEHPRSDSTIIKWSIITILQMRHDILRRFSFSFVALTQGYANTRTCWHENTFSLSFLLFLVVCSSSLARGDGRESERRQIWPSHQQPSARDRFLDGITLDESNLARGIQKIPPLV